MPHWIVLLVIVLVGWMILAVVGGWLVGRGLGAIERRSDRGSEAGEQRENRPGDLRRAA
jgi:hypothetical protein